MLSFVTVMVQEVSDIRPHRLYVMHCFMVMFAVIRVSVFICGFMQGCTVVRRQRSVVTEFLDVGS